MFATPGTPSQVRSTGRRAPGLILAGTLLVAAILRLAALTHSPPGLNQDEAANAWNAWCLLHTGRDQAGESWPVFYARALGGNRSTSYIYALLPFQALGGLNVWTARLPAAFGGVLTVWLLYWVATRLFDRPTGLVAAGLLALNPWHMQLSRFGHEAALGPLLTALALASLLWAGLPAGRSAMPPRWWRALLAGLVTGVACYGYQAVRIFLPVFIAASAVAALPAILRCLRTRAGAAAALAFSAGLAGTFGPLAYQHVANPAVMARRAERVWLWQPDDPLATRARLAAARYAAHFGPGVLFADGDRHAPQNAPGWGAYHWYALPLMLAGLVATLAVCRRDAAARVVLCWVLLYPLGDCLFQHGVHTAGGMVASSLHALRAAPGLCGPLLLAAVGATAGWRFVWARRRGAAIVLVTALGVAVVGLNVPFLADYFGRYPRRVPVYHAFHGDLMEACRRLRLLIAGADAVFITADGMNLPYIVSLVGLEYAPANWFAAEKDRRTFEETEWDYYFRVGRLHFVYDRSVLAALESLEQNGQADRVIFIMRPHELRWTNPTETIVGPDGNVALVVFDVEL